MLLLALAPELARAGEDDLDQVAIRLPWFHQFQFAGYYAAEKEGYYREEGLKVEILQREGGLLPVEEVLSGRAQFGVANADLALLRLQGKPVVVLASVFQHSPWALMTLKSSGLAVPADLVGRRVVLEMSYRDAEIQAMFLEEAVPIDRLVRIKGGWEIDPLIDGSIDALLVYVTDQPFYLQERGIEYNLIRPATYGIDFYGDCLFTSEEVLERHPERVAAFRRASLKGWEYALDHPGEMVAHILATYHPEVRGFTRERLVFEAEATARLMHPDLVEVGHMNPGRWHRIAETYASLGMVEMDEPRLSGLLYDPDPAPDYEWVRWTLGGAAVLALLLAAFGVANLRLRRVVYARTRELRNANEDLRREVHERALGEARLRLVLGQMPAALWTTDAKLVLASSTGEGLAALGLGPDRAVGKAVAEVFGTNDPGERAVDAHRRALAGEVGTFEVERGGRTFGAKVVPLFAEGGRIEGTIGALLDITERKRVEEERRLLEARLLEAQKLESLGVLAGGIAHDFNNLLVGVLGHAGLGRKLLPPDSPAQANFAHIETAAERAAGLSNQLLAYSGKGRFLVQPLDLSELVEEMGQLLRTAISTRATLLYRFAPGIPAVEADPTQIRQVVMNLITNASDSLGERSGIITVSTGVLAASRATLASDYLREELPEGRYVFLEVSDTGCGMDSATRARIFEPFFTTKFTGRGLGLSAVLGIVRGHRGTIQVASEPGAGTTFRVLLPCCDRPARRSAERPAERPAGPPSGRRTVPDPRGPRTGEGTVLVVDDEAAVLDVVREALEGAGYRVLTAANGREAIRVLAADAGAIGAVLLDMTMPEMGGEEAFRELRRLRPDLAVILTSGYAESEAAERFAGRGLAGFLQKPFRPDDLLERLRHLPACPPPGGRGPGEERGTREGA